MQDIVSRATQRVSTALVSNTNEFHYNYCTEAIPAMKMLPRHYLSYKLGVMKPRPEFYSKVLDAEQRNPHETLLIDDVEENVKGAEKAGLVGILFKNADELEKKLKEQKVI